MATLPLKPTRYSLEVPSSYVHEGQGEGKPLLLLIHGFADSAPSFLRRAFPAPDPRFEILAPNGPFPLPQRVENEWKEAYGWYFADLSRNQIHIHPSVAAGAIASLVRELGLERRAKVLVGFSQGGYFLPHLAHELREVRRLIAIGSGFHPEYFEKYGLRVPVSAVHGEEDEVIPFAEAAADFARLGTWNQGGRLVPVPGMAHALSEGGRAALRELLGEPLPGPG